MPEHEEASADRASEESKARPTRSYPLRMRSPRPLGIRTKILAIAMIPSLVLLIIGVTAAAVLVEQGTEVENYASAQADNLAITRTLVTAVQHERNLSMWRLAGEKIDPVELNAARADLDSSIETLVTARSAFDNLGAAALEDTSDAFQRLQTQLPILRARVDSGAMPTEDVYRFYGGLLEGVFKFGVTVIEQSAPDASSALQLKQSFDLLYVMESLSQTGALTAAAVSPERLPAHLATIYRNLVGAYHTGLTRVHDELEPEFAQRIDNLIATQAWQRLTSTEEAVLHPASLTSRTPTPDPVGFAEWREAAAEVDGQLMTVWVDHAKQTQQRAADTGSRNARRSVLAGAAVVVFALAVLMLSAWLANRLIGRLKRLRRETLAVAEVQLPDAMLRLGRGETVDVDSAVPHLDFGSDEIGSVAEAFRIAHTAAIAAAVNEARTRSGIRAVFMNIARRSQTVAHRQLTILDEAERNQEDPALLDIFFRLDHLATRERRNAENLLILGGDRPGRQWRHPVSLMELVRGSIAESVDYTRAQLGIFPDLLIVGAAVADLIHLLAELIDNAASFSPRTVACTSPPTRSAKASWWRSSTRAWA